MGDADLRRQALDQASLGMQGGAMPIGAVLALDGEVVAEAHWQGVASGLLGHPEHLLLLQADETIEWSARRDATLYTTLEPCLMCLGTAMSFFLGRIVYAMAAPADGAASVAVQWRPTLGHPTGGGDYSLAAIEGGLFEPEARALLGSWLAAAAMGPSSHG